MNQALRKKRVIKAPKVLKPGAAISPGERRARLATKAKAKLEETGKAEDAVALMQLKRTQNAI